MAGPTGLKPALTSVTRKDTVNYATIPKSFRSLPDATRKSLWVALEFNTVCPTTSDQPSTGNTRPRFVFKLPDGTLGSSPTSELTSNFLAARLVSFEALVGQNRHTLTGIWISPLLCSATLLVTSARSLFRYRSQDSSFPAVAEIGCVAGN